MDNHRLIAGVIAILVAWRFKKDEVKATGRR